MNRNPIMILLLSADTPEQLRPVDVERVLDEAFQEDYFEEFQRWLLQQNLKDSTRQKVESFSIHDFEEGIV